MIKKIFNTLFRLLFIDINGFLYELYFYFILKGKISGMEHIPSGPCIFVFNHVSYLDFCICYPLFKHKLKKKLHFLAKHKLFESAFWRNYLVHSDSIVVDYSNMSSIKRVFMQMKEVLANGDIVALFPEGTRSADGHMKPAAEGIGSLVLDANVPIVPVGLNGFYEAWPRHQKLPGVARAHIKIGKPFSCRSSDFLNRKVAKGVIAHLVMHKIAELVQEDYIHTPEKIAPLMKTIMVDDVGSHQAL